MILFEQVREGFKWEELVLDRNMSLTIDVNTKEKYR